MSQNINHLNLMLLNPRDEERDAWTLFLKGYFHGSYGVVDSCSAFGLELYSSWYCDELKLFISSTTHSKKWTVIYKEDELKDYHHNIINFLLENNAKKLERHEKVVLTTDMEMYDKIVNEGVPNTE